MKTHSISNQNFNGCIKVINRYATNTPDNPLKYLPIGSKQMSAADKIIAQENFDVYVSRNSDNPRIFEIRPDAEDTAKSIVLVHERDMKLHFSDNVRNLIALYKKSISKTN